MENNMKRFLIIPFLALTACATASGGESEPTTASQSKSTDKVAEKVRKQAAFDLDCNEAELVVERISLDASFMGVKNATYGARGCAKRARYKTSCGMGACQVLKDG